MNSIILSWDVGVIHLSYCLLTQKNYLNEKGEHISNWDILDWNNIDLTNRNENKCHCGKPAKMNNIIDGEIKYYCKLHSKKVINFEDYFKSCDKKLYKCSHLINSKLCNKNATFCHDSSYFCSLHAKQIFKLLQLKNFKNKSSTTLNFDDVKYSLMMELEKRPELLKANFVVIENQPSFKNPRMKSIASTLYDYYLIRGIIDKSITKSNINAVKFLSPSNKLKIANDGDTKQLIKIKNTDDSKAYKLTKNLGIKYCLDLTCHLPKWQAHFNSFKKKDDLADSFLQGAYFYNNINNQNIKNKNKNNNNNNNNEKDNEIEI